MTHDSLSLKAPLRRHLLVKPGSAAADPGGVKVALVAVFLALVGVAAVRHERGRRLEHRLAAVAGTIAGRPVHVHCQGVVGEALDVGSEAGTVDFDARGRPADRTALKRSVCRALARFPHDVRTSAFDCMVHDLPCGRRIDEEAYSVHVLAHESWHLRGFEDEATAECLALQTTADTAERLGADVLRAAAVARFALEHVYPRMPDEYRSGDCRDGGRLDLRPSLAAWPG